MRRVMIMTFMRMVMMLAARKQPGARDVDRKTETGDRDRLGKMNRDRSKDAADGFIADQERDHREHDGAGEAGEIAELAGAARERRIVGVLARVGVGERGQ